MKNNIVSRILRKKQVNIAIMTEVNMK